MPTAGTVVLTAAEATFFIGVCTEFTCWNDGAAVALINVLGLHDDDEWFSIPVDESQAFELPEMGLVQVKRKTGAGTASVRYGVTATTERL